MPVTLTRARQSDASVIRQLAQEIWRAYYPAIISGDQIECMLDKLYNLEVLHQQMANKAHAFWLVYAATQQPIGFIGIEDKGKNVHFIHKFYMALRGKGLGSEALGLLLGTLPPGPVLQLYVNRRNYQSVNFYFKNGFKIRAWIDQPIEHGFVLDDYLMEYQSPYRPA